MKIKKNFKQLHDSKPYIEPIFLFFMTSAFGFVSSIYASQIVSKQLAYFYDTPFLGIAIVIIAIVVLYYVFLSTYSFKYREIRQKAEDGKKELLSAYLNLVKKDMKQGNVESFDKTTYMFQIAIEQLDKVEEGGE